MNNEVSRVILEGREIELGSNVSVEKAKEILSEFGVSVSETATPQVTNGAVEFLEPRGQNGLK